MYDFHFGDRQEVLANPEGFLIFCKRLLPRWVNGIPDSECIAVWRMLQAMDVKEPVLVETGSGASSLALFLHAALSGGKLFSWDTNGSKGAFLRQVVSDAMCRVLEVDLHKVWTFISFNSTDPHVGIEVLRELELKVHFGFFDSWHTLDHLLGELACFERVAAPSFHVALDDAYYDRRHHNYAFVNMIRRKLRLPAVAEPAENRCQPFYVEIEAHLKARYPKVEKIADDYKKTYTNDIFFDYYEADRRSMNRVGMEKSDQLEHRLDAWRVG
jgi:hypothetical protein